MSTSIDTETLIKKTFFKFQCRNRVDGCLHFPPQLSELFYSRTERDRPHSQWGPWDPQGSLEGVPGGHPQLNDSYRTQMNPCGSVHTVTVYKYKCNRQVFPLSFHIWVAERQNENFIPIDLQILYQANRLPAVAASLFLTL